MSDMEDRLLDKLCEEVCLTRTEASEVINIIRELIKEERKKAYEQGLKDGESHAKLMQNAIPLVEGK